MKRFAGCLGAAAALLCAGSLAAHADTKTERITYSIGDTQFEGVLVWDGSVSEPRPAVLMAPNFMGVTDAAIEKATRAAGDRYVIFVADMYGVGIRPKDGKEASAAAGVVRKDLAMQRERINTAFEVMLEEAGKRNLIDPERTAAIGFCFGGGNVLELARSGRDTKAVVSFHGSLQTPRPEDAKNITASVLVLHGDADPVVPESHRLAFEKEMRDGGVKDWQVINYSNAVHSFTNPYAKAVGRSHYDERVARRAFAAMNDLFGELF